MFRRKQRSSIAMTKANQELRDTSISSHNMDSSNSSRGKSKIRTVNHAGASSESLSPSRRKRQTIGGGSRGLSKSPGSPASGTTPSAHKRSLAQKLSSFSVSPGARKSFSLFHKNSKRSSTNSGKSTNSKPLESYPEDDDYDDEHDQFDENINNFQKTTTPSKSSGSSRKSRFSLKPGYFSAPAAADRSSGKKNKNNRFSTMAHGPGGGGLSFVPNLGGGGGDETYELDVDDDLEVLETTTTTLKPKGRSKKRNSSRRVPPPTAPELSPYGNSYRDDELFDDTTDHSSSKRRPDLIPTHSFREPSPYSMSMSSRHSTKPDNNNNNIPSHSVRAPSPYSMSPHGMRHSIRPEHIRPPTKVDMMFNDSMRSTASTPVASSLKKSTKTNKKSRRQQKLEDERNNAQEFTIGQLVQLQGLQNDDMNGRKGRVYGKKQNSDRYHIALFAKGAYISKETAPPLEEEDDYVAIRPKNLRLITWEEAAKDNDALIPEEEEEEEEEEKTINDEDVSVPTEPIVKKKKAGKKKKIGKGETSPKRNGKKKKAAGETSPKKNGKKKKAAAAAAKNEKEEPSIANHQRSAAVEEDQAVYSADDLYFASDYLSSNIASDDKKNKKKKTTTTTTTEKAAAAATPTRLSGNSQKSSSNRPNDMPSSDEKKTKEPKKTAAASPTRLSGNSAKSLSRSNDNNNMPQVSVDEFVMGEYVQLHGLKTEDMNGREGYVYGMSEERIHVVIDQVGDVDSHLKNFMQDRDYVAIRPENLLHLGARKVNLPDPNVERARLDRHLSKETVKSDSDWEHSEISEVAGDELGGSKQYSVDGELHSPLSREGKNYNATVKSESSDWSSGSESQENAGDELGGRSKQLAVDESHQILPRSFREGMNRASMQSDSSAWASTDDSEDMLGNHNDILGGSKQHESQILPRSFREGMNRASMQSDSSEWASTDDSEDILGKNNNNNNLGGSKQDQSQILPASFRGHIKTNILQSDSSEWASTDDSEDMLIGNLVGGSKKESQKLPVSMREQVGINQGFDGGWKSSDDDFETDDADDKDDFLMDEDSEMQSIDDLVLADEQKVKVIIEVASSRDSSVIEVASSRDSSFHQVLSDEASSEYEEMSFQSSDKASFVRDKQSVGASSGEESLSLGAIMETSEMNDPKVTPPTSSHKKKNSFNKDTDETSITVDDIEEEEEESYEEDLEGELELDDLKTDTPENEKSHVLDWYHCSRMLDIEMSNDEDDLEGENDTKDLASEMLSASGEDGSNEQIPQGRRNPKNAEASSMKRNHFSLMTAIEQVKNALQYEEMLRDLKKKGLSREIFCYHDPEDDDCSEMSMTDQSYIMDLASQIHQRAALRQEELLEMAFDQFQHLASKKGGNFDGQSEELFLQIHQQVTEKHGPELKERDDAKDRKLRHYLSAVKHNKY